MVCPRTLKRAESGPLILIKDRPNATVEHISKDAPKGHIRI